MIAMMTSRHRAHWLLDPEVSFLNHGSFGACPEIVLEHQSELRERLERQPVQFMVRELESMLDASREQLAAFLGAEPSDLAFVPNATAGVNAVVRSLRFEPGDEVLVTDHGYQACTNALAHAAERCGARVVVAKIPFPLESAEQVVDAVLGAVTPQTALALLDHVTSPTGLVLPVERLVGALNERGVDSLVDGAHAPGMVDLDVPAVGAAYYTGNCHKWLCAPKGAGFLWVREDRRESIRPVAISHGATVESARPRFWLEFDWTGTHDPTPYLCVPPALDFLEGLFEGGWTGLRNHNRDLVLRARASLCRALDVPAPAPEEMIGSLAAVPLPEGTAHTVSSPLYTDPLQDLLVERHGIEVPVVPWPKPPQRLIRVSAQAYNSEEEYQRLSSILLRTLERERA